MASSSTTKIRKPIYLNPSSNDVVIDGATLSPSQNDVVLSTSSHLTREELLHRRLTRTRKLTRFYRHHFWAFMEDLRAQYRQYYWKYGVSPFSHDIADDHHTNNNYYYNGEFDNFPEGCVETNIANNYSGADNGGGKLGLGFGESGGNNSNHWCAYSACKLKAMALTSFCHLHILSDPNQKLYKPCNFVIKAPEQGQILCGMPILNSAVPSLCNVHLPKTLKDVKQALKKAGLSVSSSGRLAPKFHVVVAEYVQLIQSKRRAAQKRNKKGIVKKEESSS